MLFLCYDIGQALTKVLLRVLMTLFYLVLIMGTKHAVYKMSHVLAILFWYVSFFFTKVYIFQKWKLTWLWKNVYPIFLHTNQVIAYASSYFMYNHSFACTNTDAPIFLPLLKSASIVWKFSSNYWIQRKDGFWHGRSPFFRWLILNPWKSMAKLLLTSVLQQ